MTLKARLLLAIIPLVAVSMVVMTAVSLRVSIDEATDALTNAAQDKLTIQNKDIQAVVSDYIDLFEKQNSTMADTVATATEEQDATSSTVSENVMRISSLAEDIEHGASESKQSAQDLARITANASELVQRFRV